jgi:hypothetical protein
MNSDSATSCGPTPCDVRRSSARRHVRSASASAFCAIAVDADLFAPHLAAVATAGERPLANLCDDDLYVESRQFGSGSIAGVFIVQSIPLAA